MTEQTIPFIDLKSQYLAYKDEIDGAMARVVDSCGFIQGPEVAALESELSEYTGVKHCITCSSGTDALLIALLTLGIQQGDEVITTPFSFFATAEVVSLLGAHPVFADIDAHTYNIQADLIESNITEKTKAIIPVNLYGQPADMDKINDIAERRGLFVIEDAAQSFGSVYRGKKSCGLATIGCTSFYPAKPLGCFGDGGALFTDDDELAAAARCLMNHGQDAGYRHSRIGINGRLDALQAAVLRVKLAHFDEELAARERVAERYSAALESSAFNPPRILPDRTSVFAQYTVRTEQRDTFRSFLKEHGVPSAVHYPLPIYRQEAYLKLWSNKIESYAASCPNTEAAAREVVSLPFGPFLSEEAQERVIEAIKSI